jgi:hypothetical protein
MKKIFLLIFPALFPSLLFCQTEKMLVPSDMKQQTIVTEPLSLRKGYVRAGLTYSYNVLDKYFNSSAKKNYFPESLWGMNRGSILMGQYGITDRIMIEADIPYTNDLTAYHSQLNVPALDTSVSANRNIKGKGIGDIIISLTYQIIPSAENNFSVKGTIDFTLPTGKKNPSNIKSPNDYNSPTGYGAFVITPRLTVRKVSYPFSYTGYLFYSYNFEGKRIINPGDTEEKSFTWGNLFMTGGILTFHLNEWIAMSNDLYYTFSGKGKIENTPASDLNNSWSLAYEPKIVFQIKRFRLGEAVTIPLKGKNTGADPHYLVIGQYLF